jgi:hypothetical protein
MTQVSLTQSQLAAMESFKQFLEGPQQVFILKGAAGTGKTTVVGAIVEQLSDTERKVHLMAPTGRAAFLLGSKTEHKALTIHKSIYTLNMLEPSSKDENEDVGFHAKFGLRIDTDALDDIYFVDEASLISDTFAENETFSFGSGCLLHDLFEYVHGRKIIFVGDHAQLPPIGMNFSPALDAEYIRDQFGCDVVECILSEVIRQGAQSGILHNATKIREHIENKSFIEFKLQETDDCHCESINLLRPYFELSEIRPNVNAAIIAYSNKNVQQYNQLVREHYFGENANRLLPGELLVICRNNYSNHNELFNGNIIQVISCQDDADVERRTVGVNSGKKVEHVDLYFRKISFKFNYGSDSRVHTALILDNFLDSASPSISRLLSAALIVDFNNRLPQKIKEYLPQIKRLLRTQEQLSPEQRELYKAYHDLLLSDPYYNAVICKYGYAMTCHKAQGGEWENVFVDMFRFGSTANENYFRWAYTAITRASQKLCVFRSPEFSYISNLVVMAIQKSTRISITPYAHDADNFRETRFSKIAKIASEQNLSVSEDNSRQYQQWVTFSDSIGNRATFVLWYSNNGYSTTVNCRVSSSTDFTSQCSQILDTSLIPEEIPFETPDRPFAQRLHRHILSLLDECDIQLLNVTQEQYFDSYLLKTDGFAKVEIYHTDKGNYSTMKPMSSIGTDDKKLESFCQKFK